MDEIHLGRCSVRRSDVMAQFGAETALKSDLPHELDVSVVTGPFDDLRGVFVTGLLQLHLPGVLPEVFTALVGSHL